MQDESYKYWAFISYSHRDQAWAEWLHRALETYRVPRRLVGRDSAAGPVPRRLFPVFRDQEELPSSPNLSGAIDQALRQSRYLIVIASPYGAVSKWVDQEIARFRSLGRGDRILCLIVDGEPHAELQPDKGFLECFPPALRAIDGIEPIAADVRPGRDGRAAARIKLIAGLLGVGLDELRRRERRRRLLQRLSWTAAGLVAAAMFAAVWIGQQREKQLALAQQALQEHIQTVYEKGRQELIAHNQARAAVYLNEAYRLGVDTPALRLMLARAMHIVDAQRAALQNGSAVTALRFSPNSRLLATVAFDDVGRIWSLDSGRKLFEWPFPRYGTNDPRFSRDSRLIFYKTVGNDYSHAVLHVWDMSQGRELASLQTPYFDHTFNPINQGSRHVAVATPDGNAVIVDLQSGRVVKTIQGHYTVAGFSRDGSRFFTGEEDGEVVVWSGDASRKLRTLHGLAGHIVDIDDTEDGHLIAASARDGSIRVWQLADGRLRMAAGHPSPNPVLIFNMDGTRLLTNAHDGVRVWNTGNGQLVYVKQSLIAGGRFDISSYASWILEANGGRVSVQDTQSGQELYTLDAHLGEPPARDISEDDKTIATGGIDGRVVLWNVPEIPDAEFRHEVDAIRWAADASSGSPTAAATFSHSGRLIATGAGDGLLKLWDAGSHRLIRGIQADAKNVSAVAFSDDDALIATGGYVDGVKLWDVGSGALLQHFDAGGHGVYGVSINRDKSAIAAAIAGGITRLWTAGGELTATFKRDQVRSGRFSPDGKTFVIGMQGQVRLWDIARRSFIWSTALNGAKASVAAASFNRDGTRILAADFGQHAVLIDARTGATLATFTNNSADRFNSAAFSGDGQEAVLGEQDSGALLWWPSNGHHQSIAGHTGGVRTAEFSPDDSFVMTSGADGTAKLWDAKSGQLLDMIGEQPSQVPQVPSQAAGLSPDMQWALTGSVDGVFRLWNLREESRSPAQISAILKCRVPWQLDGDALQPVAPQSAGCAD